MTPTCAMTLAASQTASANHREPQAGNGDAEAARPVVVQRQQSEGRVRARAASAPSAKREPRTIAVSPILLVQRAAPQMRGEQS